MNSRVQIKIESGIIEGLICPNEFGDSENSKYFSFQGVPYGTAERFRPPKSINPWKGVKEVIDDGDQCYSRHLLFKYQKLGSEDCLNLNIYTPNLPSDDNKNKLLNVMVFIHGGAFVAGSNSKILQGPEFLLRENIVLVVINYRLGILGFLHLDDPELDIPGNNGFRDIILALQWVQRNIKYFNGDKNNVTIFGESAGGVAVHLLVLSTLAQGLFHRAIIQSGCALNLWTKSGNIGKKLSDILGIQHDDKKLLKKLSAMSVEELHDLQEKIHDNWNVNEQKLFGYVIENKNQKIPPFLSENPSDIMKKGQYNHVPLIFGYTSREGMLIQVTKRKFTELIPEVEDTVPYDLNLKRGSILSKRAGHEILTFYFGKQPPFEDNDISYLLCTDNFFVREILKAVRIHAKTSKQPVFLYEMNLETSLNVMKNLCKIKTPGVCHADDLGYLFRMPIHDVIPPNSVEDIGIRRFCRLWTNFAKYANPNSISTDSLLLLNGNNNDEKIWKPFDVENQFYLDINFDLSCKKDPIKDRMIFWDSIYTRYLKIEHKL